MTTISPGSPVGMEFFAARCRELKRLRLCGGGEGIPSLAEFLREGEGAPLILELKSDFSGDFPSRGKFPAALPDHAGRWR